MMTQSGMEYLSLMVWQRFKRFKQLLISLDGGSIEVVEQTVGESRIIMPKGELKAFMVVGPYSMLTPMVHV
jgi:hypothetical protein